MNWRGYFPERPGPKAPLVIAAFNQPGPAIDGVIAEVDGTSSEVEDKAGLDAAIVANCQAVEHYEIARYGTLIAWGEELAPMRFCDSAK
jgi:ferritin-like metal-binding protein YciE